MTTAAARTRFNIVPGDSPSSRSPETRSFGERATPALDFATTATPSGALLEPGEPLRRPLPSASRRAFEIFAVWTLIGLFIAAQRYLRGPSLQPRLALPLHESLAASLVTAYLWAALTPGIMRVSRRFRPRHGVYASHIPALLGAGIAAALLHLLATNVFWHVFDSRGSGGDFAAMFYATLAFGGAARLATFIGIVGVTWGIDDYRTFREKELQASELDRELVQTQLEALKLRLHPPFLFNTLATILPLIRTEPRAAARTVVQLGDILRLALYNDATGLVPLRTELEYIRLYLQIEQTRLQDRLEVRYAIAPEVLNAAVPNLILLPLAESAIANGISVRSGRAAIEIRAWSENGELRLDVRETAIEEATPPKLFGAPPVDQSFVTKTRLRLELLYPGRHLIGMSERREDGHEVSITLPLEEAGLRPSGASLSV
ncbi:MAG: histidine kinase [Thermoanaerobaculia bacterium]